MFTSTGLRAAGSNGNCIVTARGDNQSTGDVSLLIPAASLGKDVYKRQLQWNCRTFPLSKSSIIKPAILDVYKRQQSLRS